MADNIMSEAVKSVLLESFMKKRDGDVHTKAAQMMAIDLLHDGWKELELQLKKSGHEPEKRRQVGL